MLRRQGPGLEGGRSADGIQLGQPAVEPQAVEKLARQQSPAVGAETLPAGLDVDRAAAIGREVRRSGPIHHMAPRISR